MKKNGAFATRGGAEVAREDEVADNSAEENEVADNPAEENEFADNSVEETRKVRAGEARENAAVLKKLEKNGAFAKFFI